MASSLPNTIAEVVREMKCGPGLLPTLRGDFIWHWHHGDHSELTTLRREMDRLFERFMGEGPSPELPGGTWEPRLDLSETRDTLSIKAELPRIEAKDLEVSVSGDILTIRGEKKHEKRRKTSIGMWSNGAMAHSYTWCGCRRPWPRTRARTVSKMGC